MVAGVCDWSDVHSCRARCATGRSRFAEGALEISQRSYSSSAPVIRLSIIVDFLFTCIAVVIAAIHHTKSAYEYLHAHTFVERSIS